MIAVYGDSYGIDYEESWTSILCSELNQDQLNKCEGGSSTDFAYSNFLKTHHLADTVVFIVSSYTRGSIFTLKNNKTEHLAFYQNTSLAEIDSQNKGVTGKRIDKQLGKIIKNEIYKNTLYDSNVMYHSAYIDSIKLRRPDAHILYAFPFPSISPVGMINISQMDWTHLGLEEDDDFRKCHMSNIQNRQFANYMKQHIETDFDIHSTFIRPEKFYTKSETKEHANWI